MKGIAHFASGLCVASCIPGVTEAAADGSLLIALGGAAAMLPDWLDFRFARFLERRSADIAPEAGLDDAANATQIACALAAEIHAARESGPRVVQLHPRRLGAVHWLLYCARLDPAAGAVIVTMGDASASAFCGPIDHAYDGVFDVGELGGPSVRFVRDDALGVGVVRSEFLPWHRTWSHSLLLAAGVGVLAAQVWGGVAGVVAAFGFATHVLEDQLGHLGSNLFWPLTHKRGSGLRLMHSVDAIPNMLTVWLALAITLVNLDRANPIQQIDHGAFVLLGMLLPAVVLLARYAHNQRTIKRLS
jgi:membrane-bound metal-dependent hydrolase YbcI (DUF457 family)